MRRAVFLMQKDVGSRNERPTLLFLWRGYEEASTARRGRNAGSGDPEAMPSGEPFQRAHYLREAQAA